jgi:hypothetical protein
MLGWCETLLLLLVVVVFWIVMSCDHACSYQCITSIKLHPEDGWDTFYQNVFTSYKTTQCPTQKTIDILTFQRTSKFRYKKLLNELMAHTSLHMLQ